MTILTVRTDRPEAELGIYEGQKQLAYIKWQAHRELSDTIHRKIRVILKKCDKDWPDIEGIVCFEGPGSFTGLRIGLSVANALAYSLGIPIIASSGEGWIEQGIKKLDSGQSDKIALPKYGAEPHITKPKK